MKPNLKSFAPAGALFAVAIVVASLVSCPLHGQLFQRWRSDCFNGNCPAPSYVFEAPPVEPPALETAAESPEDWYQTLYKPRGVNISDAEAATVRSFAGRAVRVIAGNACGSGNLCGRNDEHIYIMTNAHVAGTRIGRTVRCEALSADGQSTEKFDAQVIEAAYSSKTSTDWALLRADARYMADLTPIPLSTTSPDDSAVTGTWGCPRCEVPSGQVLRTVDLGSLWYWQPNAIGGQSGSAVVQDNVQKGLLTWTIQGNGSGQLTSTIYRQHVHQNTDGPARPEGLDPLTPAPVDLQEGYFAETDLGNYPIWDNRVNPDDPGPGDEDLKNDPDVKRLLDVRARAKERGMDWLKLFNLIMQLIDLIMSSRQ